MGLYFNIPWEVKELLSTGPVGLDILSTFTVRSVSWCDNDLSVVV